MQETTTRVPAALRELARILRATFDASETTILVGPPTGRVVQPCAVALAFSANGAAVDVSVTRMQGYGHRYTETAAIQCAVSVAGGDQSNILGLTDVAGSLHAAITSAVKADPTLAGAVDAAQVTGAHSWLTGQFDTGPVVDALFTIIVKSAL